MARVNVNINQKDKKTLLYLLIFIVAAIYYLIYQGVSAKLSEAKEKYDMLLEKEAKLNQTIIMYNKNKDNIEKIKLDYVNLSQKFAPNLDEKFCLVDALNLLRRYGVQMVDLPIAKGQGNDEKNKSAVYSYVIKINTEISYDNLKKLLSEAKNFTTVYSIENIAISPGKTPQTVTASFDLFLYGYKDEQAPQRIWQDFSLPTGKTNIISSTKQVSENKNSATVVVVDNSIIKKDVDYFLENKDFGVSVSTLYSPTTAVNITKTGENFIIYGKNKQIETATIDIKQNGEKLLYRMSTEGDAHPLNNTYKEFKPNTDEVIIFVYSNPRKYDEDKNVVLLNVKNDSKKRVQVVVYNDDKNLPRVNVLTSGANIFVEKR